MGLRIQNNVEAFNAHRQLTQTSNKAAKAMERLSSGFHKE
jgi:flagellin